MKRFRFQLQSVLEYKQQILDALMVDLGKLQEKVRVQTEKRDTASQNLYLYDTDCNRRKLEGMTIVEAMEAETCLQVLEQTLQREEEALEKARRLAENKRLQVVEARKETYTLEKLKEMKRKEYDAAVAKADERMIEDLTASRRVMSNTV